MFHCQSVCVKYTITTTNIYFILEINPACVPEIASAPSVRTSIQMVHGISFAAKNPSSKPEN